MSCKSQLGRSMIEMLGVLAIIGVLSIGGLAGYTRAMRMNKLNNAADYISRVKVEYKARLVSGAIDPAAHTNCSVLVGENPPSGVSACACRSRNGSLVCPGCCWLQMEQVDLLKDLAVRVSATPLNNLEGDPIPAIQSYIDNGNSGLVSLIFCTINSAERVIVGGFGGMYAACAG